MEIKNKLKRINDSLQPYYLFFTMVFFFITSIFSLARFFSSSKSDVAVIVKYDTMEYPSSINNKYISVYNSIIQSKDSTINRKDSDDVRKYLTQTQSVKHITIKNNRNRVISNVAFRDCSVSTLTAYGAVSSYKTEKDNARLLKQIKYDSKNNIVYIEEPLTLLPQEELYITLWGSFNTSFEKENLFVNYDDHTAKVITSKAFSGFAAIVAEYYGFFFLFILLIFFVVFYYSLARKKND